MNNVVTEWARFYYELGLQPLPARGDRKGPALDKYAHWRDGERIPAAWLQDWPAPNCQVCLGVVWNLVVVDVDGPLALARWHDWHQRGRTWPETWTVASRRGLHFWYLIPQGVRECKSRAIWIGQDKHSEIRILGDKSLIMAPPSHYPGDPSFHYEFLHGRSPCDMESPSVAPGWLFGCPEFLTRNKTNFRRDRWSGLPELGGRNVPDSFPTVAAIPPAQKMSYARKWGLRLAADGPNPKGWVSCHAIDRPDNNPSASLNVHTGVFWQSGERSISFPGLAVALGAAQSLGDAFKLLGIDNQGAR